MSIVKRVLIAGGGIAGMTAAIALQRQGIASVIVERNPEWSVYGVGIIQPSNMLRALRKIGLGDACLQAGFGFHGWRFCDRDGHELARVPSANVAGPGYPAANGIARSALHALLQEGVHACGIPVRLGVSVTQTINIGNGVRVVCSDGITEDFDLLIVAEGAYSRTREAMFGDTYRPRFTGQSVWRYNFPRSKESDWGSLYYGSKSKAGLVPLSESLMYLLLVTPEPGNPRMPPESLHSLLRERLSEYGGIVGELREQIVDPKSVVYRPMEVVMLPTPWHQGRIVLIGDAAHSGTPHLAQGAAMAIEDSVALAEELAADADVEQALSAFAQRRHPRAELVYQVGLTLGEWELAEWAGAPVPGADHGRLFGASYETLAEPI